MEKKPFEQWIRDPVWIAVVKNMKKWVDKRETTENEALEALEAAKNIEVLA